MGVNLKEGYNGDLTSREAGSVGGQMVKKMIESYEKNLYPYTHKSGRLQSRPLLCQAVKKIGLPLPSERKIVTKETPQGCLSFSITAFSELL